MDEAVAGVTTDTSIVKNGTFKLIGSNSLEIAKYWEFSQGRLGKTSAAIVRSADTATAKGEAVKISIINKPNLRHPVLLQKNVTVNPSKAYTLTFSARASTQGQLQVAIREMSTTNPLLAPLKDFTINTEWKNYTANITSNSFASPKQAIVSLIVNMPAGSNITLDNVFIKPVEGQANADRDGDGVPNETDMCPDRPMGDDPDPLRLGCPKPDEEIPRDSDNDGVPDDIDECDLEPEGDEPDEERPGCPKTSDDDDNTPPTDTDGDGVLDDVDLCRTTPQGNNPDPLRPGCPKYTGAKPTKKWMVGHYVNVSSANKIGEWAQLPNVKGFRSRIMWGELEGPAKGQYHFEQIDGFLSAIPQGKGIIIQIGDRPFGGCDDPVNLPKYISQNPKYVLRDPANARACTTTLWDAETMGHLIDLYKEIGRRYDNNPKLMGVADQETAVPLRPTDKADEFLEQLIRLHREVAPFFPKSHVLQSMNHLGDGNVNIPNSNRCTALNTLATSIQPFGSGLTNPDTVIWDGLPWNCQDPVSVHYNYAGLVKQVGSKKGDKPKPMYHVFRNQKNSMLIATGSDTSQWENPSIPRTFNGEQMNYDNMMKYTYFTAVKGYTYQPTNTVVPPFGANIMSWNTLIASHSLQDIGATGETEHDELWRAALRRFLSNPAYANTNTTCPSNIICMQ